MLRLKLALINNSCATIQIMRYTRTSGIILKRIKYKDTNKILTIYTKDLGKVSAKAKGVSKISSKKRSHLELLSLTDLYLVKTKPGYLITQAQLISPYKNIRDNFNKINYGYFILEVFDKLVEEENPNETLFAFLVKTLETFDSVDANEILPTLLNAYLVKILSLLGFYSNIKHSKLPENMNRYIQFLKANTYEDIFGNSKVVENTIQDVVENSFEFLKELVEDVTENRVKTALQF